ncbi:MAG TPA: hypothetical protein VN289_22750 [Paraburkholderia sp.]|nr:hypothetical protein [Paraburkholderia sp.]
MSTPTSTPFFGRPSATNRPPVTDTSAQRLALDNLMRRELKVGDPNDPAQVAQALIARYQNDPRAKAIAQEAQGLPFLLTPATPPAPVQPVTSSAAEWQQAASDVERNLLELTTNSLLKDLTPELQGWAQAVRSMMSQGMNAARFSLDPSQRDKTLAARRQLGDYARMARLVGALNPSVNMYYRSFAESLDEVAALLLVMMGEALANLGFEGGRYLLQAPYTEMQVRREALIFALRNLNGATQEAYGPNDWPRGIDAYRRIFSELDTQGQGDLRILLVETELARLTDELIQRAQSGSVDGLRALGSTAMLDLERFHRMVAFGRGVNPPSPPLSAYLEALQLFADAFRPSGGFRLLRIARPPILFYGLYGGDELGGSDMRLTDLVINRGRLATELDCLMSCMCEENSTLCQIMLDKVLYDIDRAIDLYAVGKSEWGAPERRAAAYSYVVEAASHMLSAAPNPQVLVTPGPPFHVSERLLETVHSIPSLLRPMGAGTRHWRNVQMVLQTLDSDGELRKHELCVQIRCERTFRELVETMAGNCIPMDRVLGPGSIIATLMNEALHAAVHGTGVNADCGGDLPTIPGNFEANLQEVVDDLRHWL